MPPDPRVWQLHHRPLCPFSRRVRLVLGERGLPYELIDAAPEDDSTAIRGPLRGRTPTLRDPVRGITLTGSRTICEYIEETTSGQSMLPGSAEQRAEIRRLVAWADEVLFEQVTLPALVARVPGYAERPSRIADGQWSMARNADALLDELEDLLDRRTWIAGPTLSLADFGAAAQISVADYLTALDWSGHDQAHTWYCVMKSRQSFRLLLADHVDGIDPPPGYSAIDL